MLNKNVEKARQAILNEIVSTLEFIEYLRKEAKDSVAGIIQREELRKRLLVFKLELLEP